MSAATQLTEWWDRRKPRERFLAVAAAALAVLGGGYVLLLKPVRIQTAAAAQQLASARSELTQLQQVVEQRDRAGSDQLRAREADLQRRLALADSQIRRAQIDLVGPQDMARQLSAILQRFPQLRVVGIVTESPVPVDQTTVGRLAAGVAAFSNSMLYEHGLELTVEGKYLDLVAYLEQLEHAPHKIYWRELDLKVNPQGVPLTRIRFFTLSQGPTWLAL
ncbi:MAG TPA: type II secretion system protein GspM [Burkholderiaceae bacterium]|jgi:MSHA biogenesis protein MshJ|nr:type II secretion system protein GspM [Burkholderiaceae bacterium]